MKFNIVWLPHIKIFFWFLFQLFKTVKTILALQAIQKAGSGLDMAQGQSSLLTPEL